MADCCVTADFGFDIADLTSMDCDQLKDIRMALFRRLFEEAGSSSPYVSVKGRTYDFRTWKRAVLEVIELINQFCGSLDPNDGDFCVVPATPCDVNQYPGQPGTYVLDKAEWETIFGKL